MKCHNCHTELPEQALFCFHCGAQQPKGPAAAAAEEPPLIDLKGDTEQQLTAAFFQALQRKLEEEQPGTDPQHYREHLYACGFRDLLQRRQGQLAQELQQQAQAGSATASLNRKVQRQIDELSDYFIIHHCKALNTVPMPEAILRHQGLPFEQLDLPLLIFDYLDFENEPDEQVYTDFVQMPVHKLRNAGRFFLKPEQRNERIFFICDQSLLGSCKEGFAMTERGLYWKAQLQHPQRALYAQLGTLRREKEWLLIDGHFFNANLRLNIRLLKLLRRIARG